MVVPVFGVQGECGLVESLSFLASRTKHPAEVHSSFLALTSVLDDLQIDFFVDCSILVMSFIFKKANLAYSSQVLS